MFHHNTIRRYTLALLNFFNKMEIQYEDDSGQIISKTIPIRYKSREKALSIDKSTEQILAGVTNVLPRAELELTGLTPESDRQVSKYLKINRNRKGEYAEFQWNCISYNFTYQVKVLCRGMNEVSQIIEQVAPKFNPNVAIDVRDAEGEQEPTRIPVQLSSIDFEVPEYDETSNNVCTVVFDLSVSGYLFEPIKTYSIVKEFNVNLKTPRIDYIQHTHAVEDSIPYFDYTRSEQERDDVLTVDNLELVFDGIDTVTVNYRCNSEIPPNITFISDTCTITKQYKNTCKVDYNGDFDICAKLEKNSEYYTVFATFKDPSGSQYLVHPGMTTIQMFLGTFGFLLLYRHRLKCPCLHTE